MNNQECLVDKRNVTEEDVADIPYYKILTSKDSTELFDLAASLTNETTLGRIAKREATRRLRRVLLNLVALLLIRPRQCREQRQTNKLFRVLQLNLST